MPTMIEKITDDVFLQGQNFLKLEKITMSEIEENLRNFLKYHVNVTDQ